MIIKCILSVEVASNQCLINLGFNRILKKLKQIRIYMHLMSGAWRMHNLKIKFCTALANTHYIIAVHMMLRGKHKMYCTHYLAKSLRTPLQFTIQSIMCGLFFCLFVYSWALPSNNTPFHHYNRSEVKRKRMLE